MGKTLSAVRRSWNGRSHAGIATAQRTANCTADHVGSADYHLSNLTRRPPAIARPDPGTRSFGVPVRAWFVFPATP
ncbi:MAG TPA: hypothetical protein VMS30_09135, partial [Phycisphaerales bacterium]|nr:hypothetical protein [Phycisphaerales bacterium]